MTDNAIIVREEISVIEIEDAELIVVEEPIIEIVSEGIQGPAGPSGSGDLSFVHTQSTPSTLWSITHNLGKRPSVTVVDSAESVIEGDVAYTGTNTLTVQFSAAFSGKAYLN